MPTYRFGIDIDGTVTDPGTFIPHLNEHFNKNLTLDDLVEYDLTRVLNVDEQSFARWMEEHEPMLYQKSVLANDAKSILHKWEKQFELFYISARPAKLHDITEEWFQAFNLPYDHIELLGSHNKIEAAKEHKVDLFLEDKHDNAVDIAEICQIPVILMNTPYNQMPVPTNVYRANSWQEANQIVSDLFAITK
ncbi:hypothetical protein FLK61_29640 [Paenalkalicoccus suaedae]|uniref:Nucleotidase n=1 Tax=Paenalkalicoccus suaedae TaxID=2592382 RepID=A0A859FK42_9BACI|nr:hypothetical protein [Paenalkalicoccus suaedae]QKS73210.1 hypothetical protein FLK61_29640 [Paenalkalicoccus suaedae]